MNRPAASGRVRVAVYLVPLALLLAVNAVAIGGILAAREGARREAMSELALETEIHARGLEAALAGLRGDLSFLSQAPPLARPLPAPASDDPMALRWRRLDVEGTLLLFLDAHPAVERLSLASPGGDEPVVAGRQAGVPVILPPDDPPPAPDRGLLVGRWRVGSGGSDSGNSGPGALAAAVRLDELLRAAAPGLEGRLTLRREGDPEPLPAVGANSSLAARVPVHDDGWEPPLEAVLVRRESASRLVQSVEQLAGRYRTTVVLNLAVIGLTVTLGLLAFRQVRRAERLADETAHQIRLRELERQLLHSERLASVGRLAAGMAHEINNPLEGMGNYLSLLEAELADGGLTDGNAAARDLAGRVREGLERTAGIVHRVLAMSASGHQLHRELDLGQVAAEAVGFVRSARSFPAVEVRFHPLVAPLTVRGNGVTLGQLFLNLLLNACQAQPDGGEVDVSLASAGEWARIVVADRGPGLTPEARARLFEPFFSTRGSTGLGLAICHGIAGDHQGRIEARDRSGGGTELVVRIPLARTAGETTGDEPAAKASVLKPAAVEPARR